MPKISKNGKGKTLYIELSIYPNSQKTDINLTISCPDEDTRFKTSLTDNGLIKFKKEVLKFYEKFITNRAIK